MSTAGPNAPGTAADNSGTGVRTWGSVNNIKVLDAAISGVNTTSAGTTTTSHYLFATNLGFAIPAGSTINGVTVSIVRSATKDEAQFWIVDNIISLLKAGAVSGDNKAATLTHWPLTLGAASYGGAADLWGNALTADDINASTFGVALSVTLHDTGTKSGVAANVDFISITITYTEGGGGAAPIGAYANATHFVEGN